MNTRRIFALLLAFVMTVSILSACGDEKEANNPEEFDFSNCEWETEPGSDKYAGRTLRILQTVGGGGNYYEPIVERMKEFYPGLEIEYVYTKGAADILRTQVLNGNAPDIFNVNIGDLPLYDAINQGICAPVDVIFDVPTLDGTAKLGDLLDMRLFTQGEVDGVHYSMKDIMYITGLWYDANFFEANGLTVPSDWEDLQKLATQCDKLGIDMLGACGTRSEEYPTCYWWWPMVASTDYDLYCKLNNLDYEAWKSDEMKQVVDKMVWLRDNGLYNINTNGQDNNETQMSFITHEFALLPCGSWLEPEMVDAWTEDWNLRFLPYSFGDEVGDAYYGVTLLQSNVSVDTENMDLVCEFYRFLFSDYESIAGSTAIHTNVMKLPGFGETYSDLLAHSVKDASATTEDMKILNVDTSRTYTTMGPEIGDMIIDLMGGDITAEEFIQRGYALFKEIAEDDTIRKITFAG